MGITEGWPRNWWATPSNRMVSLDQVTSASIPYNSPQGLTGF
jgi:hypothetical protein